MQNRVEMKTLAESDWREMPEFPGLSVIILSDTLDEAAQTGCRTRLVRFAPGAKTDVVLSHPYWEEVICISGALGVRGSASPPKALNYSLRPPGTEHGPFESEQGCVLMEVQYFPST